MSLSPGVGRGEVAVGIEAEECHVTGVGRQVRSLLVIDQTPSDSGEMIAASS